MGKVEIVKKRTSSRAGFCDLTGNFNFHKALSRSLLSGALLLVGNGDASASEYGCKVMLCLSNPKGPKAEAQCISPINQLYDDLKHGRRFPTCDEAKDPVHGDSYVRQGFNYFDPCEDGTTALPRGQYAVKRGSTQLYGGIGDGEGMTFSQDGGIPPKVCVAGPVGRGSYGGYEDRIDYTIYSTLVVQQPASNPNYFLIYVNNQPYKRVRQ